MSGFRKARETSCTEMDQGPAAASEPASPRAEVRLAINAADGPMPPDRRKVQELRAGGVMEVGLDLFNCATVEDREIRELVIMEVGELLQEHGIFMCDVEEIL